MKSNLVPPTPEISTKENTSGELDVDTGELDIGTFGLCHMFICHDEFIHRFKRYVELDEGYSSADIETLKRIMVIFPKVVFWINSYKLNNGVYYDERIFLNDYTNEHLNLIV